MISTATFVFITCFCSCVLLRPIEIGERRFIDVPSSCNEGQALVHSGDCVQPFVLGINTTTTTESDLSDTATTTVTESVTTEVPQDRSSPPHIRRGHFPPPEQRGFQGRRIPQH